MIRLYRWQYEKHYQMTPIDDVNQLGDIALYQEEGEYVPIHGANITIDNANIDIKDGVEFLIGFHPHQRNIYLIIDNSHYFKDEVIFAQLKHHFDNVLEVEINPNLANTLAYFGKVITKGFTEQCNLVISQSEEGKIKFTLHLPFDWESTISFNLDDLTEFIMMDDVTKDQILTKLSEDLNECEDTCTLPEDDVE